MHEKQELIKNKKNSIKKCAKFIECVVLKFKIKIIALFEHIFFH